jgi:hypothetical protein
MSGRRLKVPAPIRTSREKLAVVEPTFLRLETDAAERPGLSTLTDDAFIPSFFDGVAASDDGWNDEAWSRLRAWRDYAEPPPEMVTSGPAPLYPSAVKRREPRPGEVDVAIADTGGLPWLRKLYLPLHQHYQVVSCEVICLRHGRPNVEPSRIVAAGAVVRRLVADPSAERWEDWIEGDAGGTWLELDGDLSDLDPQALDDEAVGGSAAAAALRSWLGVDRDLTLQSAALGPIPPTYGTAGKRGTRFGYLPVFSSTKDAPPRPNIDASAIVQGLATKAKTVAAKVLGEAPLHDSYRQQLAAIAEELLADGPGALAPWAPFAQTVDHYWHRIEVESPQVQDPTNPLIVDSFDKDELRGALVAGMNILLATTSLRSTRSVSVRDQALDAALIVGLVGASPWLSAALETSGNYPGAILFKRLLWNSYMLFVASSPQAVARGLYEHVAQSALGSQLTGPGQAESWKQRATTSAADAYSDALSTSDSVSWQQLSQIHSSTGRQTAWAAFRAWFDDLHASAPSHWPPTVANQYQRLVLAALLRQARRLRQELLATWQIVLHPNLVGPPLDTAMEQLGEAALRVLGDEIEVWTVPALAPSLPPQVPDLPHLSSDHMHAHQKMRAIERTVDDLMLGLAKTGSGLTRMIADRAADFATSWPVVDAPADVGLDMRDATEAAILLLLGNGTTSAQSAGALATSMGDEIASTYVLADAEEAIANASSTPSPRFDASHIYAVWCFARVRGKDPCEEEQIVWSGRTDPFHIAAPDDLLGQRPAVVPWPDLSKLLRDIPRLGPAGARPFAAMPAPAGSAVTTGDEMKDTRRKPSIASVCSFGIPVFTLCALILFRLILGILLLIPGFGWLLRLKFCFPPGGDS